MKFPYGIADFYKLISKGYFYVDRTDRIPLIEEAGEQLLFLRPRRFGKSLLLSMLENYYDVAKADEFSKLFGHLAIGQNPTPLHNQYFVMKWDFSLISTQRDISHIRQSLHNHLNARIKIFGARYHKLLPDLPKIDKNDAIFSFELLLGALMLSPYNLYLLIDEYDNFANSVMMSSQSDSRSRYNALVQGEGLLKTVFKAVKSATTPSSESKSTSAACR